MVGVASFDYSNYILAGIASGGAAVGAYRWFRGGAAQRKRRQAEYQALWEAVYGSPALLDEHGVEYESAQPGLVQRYNELAGGFYGHVDHPPHPRRRSSDHST